MLKSLLSTGVGTKRPPDREFLFADPDPFQLHVGVQASIDSFEGTVSDRLPVQSEATSRLNRAIWRLQTASEQKKTSIGSQGWERRRANVNCFTVGEAFVRAGGKTASFKARLASLRHTRSKGDVQGSAIADADRVAVPCKPYGCESRRSEQVLWITLCGSLVWDYSVYAK